MIYINWKKLSTKQINFFNQISKKDKLIVKISYLFFIFIYLLFLTTLMIKKIDIFFNGIWIIFIVFFIVSFICFYADLKEIPNWNLKEIIYLNKEDIISYNVEFKKLQININDIILIDITIYQFDKIKNNENFLILYDNNNYYLFLEKQWIELFGD